MAKNFNNFGKLAKEIEKRAKEASGEVSFPDLFNPNFMTTYTNFSSINEFFKKSPFTVNTKEDFEKIDKAELDKFINENTRFSSWSDMYTKAGELYMKKQLGL